MEERVPQGFEIVFTGIVYTVETGCETKMAAVGNEAAMHVSADLAGDVFPNSGKYCTPRTVGNSSDSPWLFAHILLAKFLSMPVIYDRQLLHNLLIFQKSFAENRSI